MSYRKLTLNLEVWVRSGPEPVTLGRTLARMAEHSLRDGVLVEAVSTEVSYGPVTTTPSDGRDG